MGRNRLWLLDHATQTRERAIPACGDPVEECAPLLEPPRVEHQLLHHREPRSVAKRKEVVGDPSRHRVQPDA
jgi:hypothetical protein